MNNIIDSVIGYFNPVAGLRRRQARAVMALSGNNGWNSGSRSKRGLSQWTPRVRDANAANLPELALIRERSRDEVRNHPLATAAIETLCGNVIGCGIRPVASLDPEALNIEQQQADELAKRIDREFRLWADSKQADATGHSNFYGLQELSFRSMLESGDVFILLTRRRRPRGPYSLTLQLIEADRISNPDNQPDTDNLIAGVEYNGRGEPIAYHVRDSHPGDYTNTAMSWRRIPVYSRSGNLNIIHLFKKTRPGESRGMPYLSPVINSLKTLTDYSEAELYAAAISAMFTVFVKTPGGDDTFSPMQPDDNIGGKATDDDYKLAPGAILSLAQDEEIQIANPGRPNGQFDAFYTAVTKQIATALGMPIEVLNKHFESSYSAARAALLEAWKTFKQRREFLVTQFCQPVYREWFREAVLRGRIPARGFLRDPALAELYTMAEWIGDGMPQIDPEKEVGAAETRLRIGISTRTRETQQLMGTDYEKIHRQRVKEQRMLEEDGLTNGSTQDEPQNNSNGLGDNAQSV